MNLQDTNKLIEVCNTAVKALAALATVLEETAWSMIEDHAGATGMRPVAAVQVVEPNRGDPSTPQTDPQNSYDQPTPETPAHVVSLVELRTLLAELSQAGFTERVRGLINAFGFDKLSEVPETKYPQLFTQAKELRWEVDNEPVF